MAKRPQAHQESTCRRGHWLLRLLGVVAGLSLPAGEALACQKDASGKPTVGLVLSGGGALAASQVGAIKALEENGVPIHCVVGTSMGAVVAALYASGQDADALKKSFIEADWGSIATGTLPYRKQGYRTKDDQRDFFSDYIIGLGPKGIVLPSGVSSLRGMRRFLREETEQIAHENDFDRLPVPYRATATDLNTGEAVTLAKGDLVDAALASMAVPGLYPSQMIDGRRLIDGGMSKQVPIDLARDMGAEIVIVVDLSLPPPTFVDNAPSALDTVMQMVNLQVWRNREEQIKQLGPGDLLIEPDITGYSTSAFEKMAGGYEVGYKAAVAKADQLRAIAAIAAPPRPRIQPPAESISVASVDLKEMSGIDENLVRKRFGVEAGETITRSDIHRGLDDVSTLGAFDVVDYQIIPGPTGDRIELATIPRGAGNQRLQLGLKLSTTLDGDAYYGVLGRWSLKPLNAYAGELNITTDIGTDLVFDVEWVQPVGMDGRYYVESGAAYARRTVPVYLGDVQLAERRNETGSLRFNFGRELGQWGIVSAGAFAIALDSDVRVGDPMGVGAQTGDYLGLTGRFAVDTFDSPSFPISGQVADLNLSYYTDTASDRSSEVGSLVLGSVQTIGNVATFARYEGGVLSEAGAGLPLFTLGGFKRLSGFENNSVPASSFNFLRFEAFTRMGADVEQSFGVPVYVGATLEAADIRVDDGSSLLFEDTFVAGSLYGAVDTPLGPAYLALGLGEGGRNTLYLYFGRAF